MMMMQMTYYNSADVKLLLDSWATGGDQSYYMICATPLASLPRGNAPVVSPHTASPTSPDCNLHNFLPLRIIFCLCQQISRPPPCTPPPPPSTQYPFQRM
jgi:hypothetical protein